MKFLILLCCLSLSICFTANAEMYKHTDKDGVTIYSDIPSEGAKEIKTPQGNSIRLPKYKAKKKALIKKKETDSYESFSIISPSNNKTIQNNAGNITVQLSLSPALNPKEGHSITVYINNKAAISNITSLTATLNHIDRGSHSIYAVVNDASNKLLIKSNSVTIHLKRFSKLHKKTK